MILGRVTSEVVASVKNSELEGHRILSVVPISLEGAPKGHALLAIDRNN